jgi:hypothetical protein
MGSKRHFKLCRTIRSRTFECPCGYYITCGSDRDRVFKHKLHAKSCSIAENLEIGRELFVRDARAVELDTFQEKNRKYM